jgi:hypothetical protein
LAFAAPANALLTAGHQNPENPVGRLLRLVLIVVVALTVVIGGFWYRYVSNTESPYDEVGIELNSRMPEPIRKWGCDKLQATFAGALPPYGCATGDGRTWM